MREKRAALDAFIGQTINLICATNGVGGDSTTRTSHAGAAHAEDVGVGAGACSSGPDAISCVAGLPSAPLLPMAPFGVELPLPPVAWMSSELPSEPPLAHPGFGSSAEGRPDCLDPVSSADHRDDANPDAAYRAATYGWHAYLDPRSVHATAGGVSEDRGSNPELLLCMECAAA